jgi:hypothetical protein
MTNRGHDNLQGLAAGHQFATVLADPPWQFVNRTGKMAPEHKRLNRYETLTTDAIGALPGSDILAEKAHHVLGKSGDRQVSADLGDLHRSFRSRSGTAAALAGWRAAGGERMRDATR